ncbi:MAG: hypothetical protein WCH61_05560 [bacterium]
MKRHQEPAAVRELHQIREQMLAEEKRIGSDKFWTEANRKAEEFAHRHGLKYVAAPTLVPVVRERSAKYKPR